MFIRSKKESRPPIKGLFKREYKSVHAVKDISLEVEEGEFVAFLGPNGAGKTTTLKLLSGVINPDSGTCQVMGYTPWERKNEYRRRFSLVMGQKNQLWWDLPAMESFRLNQHIYCVPKDDFDATRDRAVRHVGCDAIAEPARSRIIVGRTDEDGVDCGAVAQTGRAVS